MSLVFDMVNAMLTVWFKPVLVIALVIHIVNKPDFRSAATNHWLLLLAVLSPVLLILFFVFLPRVDIGILPLTLAAFTQTKVFSLTHGPFAYPNMLTLSLVAIYLAGVSHLLYKMYAALRQTRGLALNSIRAQSAALTTLQARLAEEFLVQQKVEIRVSTQLTAPVVWGFIHPQIILPVQSSAWSHDRLQRVLAHEYAHIARGDWLSRLLSHILCAFFWVNPLIWKAAKQCAWHAELACDDLVISKFKCRAEYADDLLELSTDAWHHSIATVGFIKKSELYLRINAILDGGKNRNAPGHLLKTLLFALVILMLLPLSVLQAKQSPYTVRDDFADAQHRVKVYNLNEEVLVLDKHLADVDNHAEPVYVPPEELKKRYGKFTAVEPLIASHLKLNVEQLAKFESKQPSRVRSDIDLAAKLQFNTVEVLPLRPLKIVTPKYPERALYRNLEATVIVALDVDTNGKVHNPRIISSNHSKLFNSTVLKAVQDFTYQPTMIDGQPIITRNVKETFVFMLKDTTDT